MMCLNIRIIGFRRTGDNEINISNVCVSEKSKIIQILNNLKEDLKIMLELDDIMIICNNKQLYIDDEIPQDCKEILIFPIAPGG